ncbi:MAG: hypothetical protein GY801_16805 [bacterium]|nr:hypothetical protein [bacterium]
MLSRCGGVLVEFQRTRQTKRTQSIVQAVGETVIPRTMTSLRNGCVSMVPIEQIVPHATQMPFYHMVNAPFRSGSLHICQSTYAPA